MQVHRDINRLPVFKNAVITIGTFDGMHCGHKLITRLLKEEADAIGGETVIVTFHPHPRMVISKSWPAASKIHLLNTLEEKISLVEQEGIGHLVIVPFTEQFSQYTAEDYIKLFLVEKFNPHTIVIGYDHRFGNKRSGDFKLLEHFAPILKFSLREIPEQMINHIAVSSTRIREALLAGDIETANQFLGYDYFFEGTVVSGDKIGRTLGYPTANLQMKDADKLVPADGVYAVTLVIKNSNEPNVSPGPVNVLKGMLSIGNRTTVGGTTRAIEVNIFNFEDDIYGSTVKVFVKKFLRKQLTYKSLEDLTAQIHQDKEDALRVLENL